MSGVPPAVARGRGGVRRGNGGRNHNSKRPASTASAMPAKRPAPTPTSYAQEDLMNQPPARATTPTHSNVRFADFHARGLISKETLAAVPFEFCTVVQAETMGPILEGHDVLARAKTGTGKTIAFMLPAIERIAKQRSAPNGQQVSILVMSPTRELAQQIAVETEMLIRGRPIGVQCVVGGTNIRAEVTRFTKSRMDILVATPGRLLDHIQNTTLAPMLSHVQCLILDEADRLLDAGFQNEIKKVLLALPERQRVPRQTLLFSATLPASVKTLASIALLPAYKHISTVSETEQTTHEHVKQELAIVDDNDIFAASAALLAEELSSDSAAKIIVFLPTARETAIFADVFGEVLKARRDPTEIFEVHSRKSQAARTKATEGFRVANRGLLFSSDVTARGIDIPGVTVVYQIGLPSNDEQYVHRLGRTARAGTQGRGVLVLTHDERFFTKGKAMAKQPLEEKAVPTAALAALRSETARALDSVPNDVKGQAYGAWIGYRKAYLRALGWSESDLAHRANAYALGTLRYRGAGDGLPPPLMSSTVGKMGLRAVRHLFNVSREEVRRPPRGPPRK